MDWLNYNHLYYFWVVAREGSVTAASAKLRLAQPTVSAQLKSIEESLGVELFSRVGRGLVLTDMGRVVFRYADEIFNLGQELMATVRRGGEVIDRLVIGVADVMPKLVVAELLDPLLGSCHVVCREGRPELLLGELAVGGVDVVLSDLPLSPAVKVRAFNHLLGESAVGVFGTPALRERYGQPFPDGLQEAPLLLPTENSVLRRSVEQWWLTNGLAPRVVGEFEDSALVKVLAQRGHGLCLAPVVASSDMERGWGLVELGRLVGVKERFYAISAEKKIRHPGVALLLEHARRRVFGEGTGAQPPPP